MVIVSFFFGFVNSKPDHFLNFGAFEQTNGQKQCNDQLGQHKFPVVEERIEILTHAVGCPLSPDGYAGNEVAKEAEHAYQCDTQIDTAVAYLAQGKAAENTRKADQREGNHIIEQNADHQRDGRFAIRKDVCGQHRLQQLKQGRNESYLDF